MNNVSDVDKWYENKEKNNKRIGYVGYAGSIAILKGVLKVERSI